jgi:hypothetical protein
VARRVIQPETWKAFDTLVKEGLSITAAAKRVGIDPKTGFNRVRGIKERDGRIAAALNRDEQLPKPKGAEDELCDEAKRALTDFEFFRLRYFGHVSTPWQVDAANRMIELLDSPDKEYVVVNVPPGAGKSTLFTHDVPAWALVRNRAERILIGSRTERQARQYVGRLKTTFERLHPPTASDELKRKGLAVDAVCGGA